VANRLTARRRITFGDPADEPTALHPRQYDPATSGRQVLSTKYKTIVVVGQDATCEYAARFFVQAILEAQGYIVNVGSIVQATSADGAIRIDIVPPTQALRPGCKVLCCRRADYSRLSANDSDDGYEFWTYGSTIDLTLEDVRSPSLESITRIAVPLEVLPEDFESMLEALQRIVTLTSTLNMATLKPLVAAIPMEVNTKEIDASFDFSSSGVLVLFDAAYRATDYQLYCYVSELRRQIGNLSPISVSLGRRYRGPSLKQLRVRLLRNRYRAVHHNGFAYFALRLYQKVARRGNSVACFSNLGAEKLTALGPFADKLCFSDLIVFAESIRFAMACLQASQVMKHSQIRRACAVVPSDLSVTQDERGEVARTGARLIFDGTGLAKGVGLHSRSRRVFDLMDMAEAPIRQTCAPSVDWRRELARSALDRDVECILFVRPAWMKCGSATTFANLVQLFRARGAVIVDVALEPFRRAYPDDEIQQRLAEVASDLNPWLHFTLSRGRVSGRPLPLIKAITAWPRTMVGLMAMHYRRCLLPAWYKRSLRNVRISAAYVNHYFTLPHLQDTLGDCSIILDTHDIQSINYTEQAYRSGWLRPQPFSRCWAEEVEYLRPARKVLMVNEDELRLVRRALPQADAECFVPLPVERRRAASRHRDMVSRAGCRLLIIASNNRANENSLSWFLHRVWPQIRRPDLVLDVVGSIRTAFADQQFEAVTMHGLVESVDEYYEMADIIVLPVTIGGGIAIKTLEAILIEKPVCPTAHALRGLPEKVRSVLPANSDDVQFVRDLAALCASPEARRSRLEQTKQAKRLMLNEGYSWRFHRALDGIRQ